MSEVEFKCHYCGGKPVSTEVDTGKVMGLIIMCEDCLRPIYIEEHGYIDEETFKSFCEETK
jgi:transcription elongation factor Elf1